jgi:glycosyltransferase involved in cell wall biosynthesis
MAAGTPVVAIGELGVLDVVRDGVNGFFAPEGEEGFAQIALDLVNDEFLYTRLKAGSLETAEDLSTNHSTLRLLEIFAGCLTPPE